MGNVVPLQREKFEGVNAEDWPYTTETPENIYILIMFFPDKGEVGGGLETTMLKYQIYQSQLKDSPSYGKYYARIVSTGTYDVKGLAEHMAKHNTPFSPGTITGILTDAIACIKELALDGKRVTLDGLLSIGLSISHKMGVDSADDFSIAKCVERVKLVALGVGEFSSSLLTSQAKLSESKTYQSPRNGGVSNETPEDPGTDPGSGGEVIDLGSGSGSNTGGSGSDSGGSDTDGGGYYE